MFQGFSAAKLPIFPQNAAGFQWRTFQLEKPLSVDEFLWIESELIGELLHQLRRS